MGRPSKKQIEAAQHAIRLGRALEYLHALPESERKGQIKPTARQFRVSYDTLRRRFLGISRPRNLAHEPQQILTHAQERALVEWLVHLSSIGRPLNKRTVRKKVKRVSGSKRTPSRKWLNRFLARHQELKLGKPSGLDPKRAQAFNEVTVERHFELLRKVMEEHQIPWDHVYNMDEKGIQRGRRNVEQEKYILHRSERPVYKLRSANLELVTVIECVCANGESLKPAFIFPGKEFHKEWFEVDPEILVCMSPNGWTDDALCAEWFEHAFIPQTNAKRVSDAPILLIYDGHGSHATPRLVELALENNIHLFCLPPHTTHKLQPLDVGVFAQLSTAWKKHCDVACTETDRGMRKQDLVHEYMNVRNASVDEDLVQSGFRACGLNPLNPNIFGPEDFAPSKVTSQHAHLPPSYPCTIHVDTTTDASPRQRQAENATSDARSEHVTRNGTPNSKPHDDFDGLFDDDFDLGSEVGAGNLSSDEDWKSATDEELLDDDLTTRYEATCPPIIVFRPDGTILTCTPETPRLSRTPEAATSTSASSSATQSPSDYVQTVSGLPAASGNHRVTAQIKMPQTSMSDPALQSTLKAARSVHTVKS
ncbi:hypothetical protein BN946_scf184671.g2 [Trametes cinnabarina]|uniref:HTH CENPB-type domain-containing protein n=1 Tax=Pycnoporus cinnabarinus TaxID=5643 RepID=A0A060SR26_PYCCI|nr:hypothetical protein BN946_scf184671.g2 [Trametes cinnabarina]